jgi:hypothetical protein
MSDNVRFMPVQEKIYTDVHPFPSHFLGAQKCLSRKRRQKNESEKNSQ